MPPSGKLQRTRVLPPQLYVGDQETLERKVWPVRNDPQQLGKPRGGFWTSTYDLDYGSAWVSWCVAYRYNDPLELHWTVLHARKSARVAVIDSASRLAALIERYPRILRQRRGLDFERLSKEYDGLHLTTDGYIQTHSKRSGSKLLGWDCESTVWFRWVFSRMEETTAHFKDLDRYDHLWHELSGWSTEDYTCRLMPENKASRKVYATIMQDTEQAKQ
jgi:hypothetical protein